LRRRDAAAAEEEHPAYEQWTRVNIKSLNLLREKVTREPDSLSDTGSAEREGRAYVMRVDHRARVTYSAATPAVRAHPTGKKGAVRKVSGAHQQLATIADNPKALDLLLGRFVGSSDASGSAGRKERAYVTRVDDRARETYAAATPAVREHASTAKRMPLEKSLARTSTLLQSLTTRR
jgi:hypothetical protein